MRKTQQQLIEDMEKQLDSDMELCELIESEEELDNILTDQVEQGNIDNYFAELNELYK